MKTFLIFCAFFTCSTASFSGGLGMLKNNLNLISENDLDKPEFPEALKDSQETIKCSIREFKNEENNQRINRKIDNLINYFASAENVFESKVIPANSLDDIDFKIVRDKCWEGKPIILDLFTEIKANIETCVENSDAFVRFLENFLEMSFGFLCNVDKKSFKDESIVEQPLCQRPSNKDYIMCLAKYHPNGFNFGICELKYKETLACLKDTLLKCHHENIFLVRASETLLEFLTEECRVNFLDAEKSLNFLKQLEIEPEFF